MQVEYPEGATPLDKQEMEGLHLSHITTREELDRWEQENILDAERWLIRKQLSIQQILTEKFIRELHKRMFQRVWKWAGDFRLTEKNLGIKCWKIPVAIHELCKDGTYWIDHKTYNPDEIAVRIHHQLVSIHPFSNGNGRHARLIADTFIQKGFDRPRFTWGAMNLAKQGQDRNTYIEALLCADHYDIKPLLAFARS